MFDLIKSNLAIDTTFDFYLHQSSLQLAAFEKNSHIMKNSSENYGSSYTIHHHDIYNCSEDRIHNI